MKLNVNGDEKQVNATTVRELMIELGFGNQPVAVELNRSVVPRRKHDETPLHEGDSLEIVSLVGGG